MRKALIDLVSKFVVQVEDTIFDVAPSNMWVDCPDNITAYRYTYENNEFKEVPVPEPIPATSDENKQQAEKALLNSDWTMLSDVNLTSANKTEWVTYRSLIRDIARNPQSGNLSWPRKPETIWN